MNANELADYITENSYIGTVTMEDVANMLRQQQAEIETYKLELYDEVMLRREQQAEIEALKDALSVKVILNEHAQQSIKEVKGLLRKAQEK